MPWCVVIGCRNNLKATKSAGKDVSYHIFPKNPERRSAWINMLNRPFKFNADSSYICSEHFIPDDFECNSLKEELLNIKIKRQLKKTAIPSVNIPKSSEEKSPEVLLNLSNSPNGININLKNINEFDMYRHCAVPKCPNQISVPFNSSDNVLFHTFPSDVKTLEKWLIFCNGSKNKTKILADYQNAQICSKHFHKDDYEHTLGTQSMTSSKVLKKDAVPSIYNEIGIIESSTEESIKLERKKLVDKLLADYDKQQKNEEYLKSMVNKYPFFAPKIDPNPKLGHKLKLLKAIDNPESYSPPKKKKVTPKTALVNIEVPSNKHTSSNEDQVIQLSVVKGGLMLYALPKTGGGDGGNPSNSSENNVTDDENEIIIVTKDEAAYENLTADSEQHKENNTELIIVSDSKETENMDIVMHIDSESIKCFTKTLTKPIDNNKCCVQDQLKKNVNLSTAVYSTDISLNEDKGCQVIIPCKGCEQRSLKINKLLRERTRLLRDSNQNGTCNDPDEINTLKKMNGVLSLLLLQCVGEKYGKKSRAIRVDIVQDSIEKINCGWSMQETSEILCQVLSANAYDELARSFSIINEV